MPTEYKIRVLSAAGAFQREFNDFRNFSYIKEVNAPGMLTFDVDGDHEIVDFLDDSLDNQVEVWRRRAESNLDWYADYRGLFRDYRYQTDADGLTTFRAYCPGQMSLLARTIVAYRGGTANRSEFTGAAVETVMRTLVLYNATSSGTTGDGRHRNVDLTGISVETDGGFGVSIDYTCENRNLLAILQELTRLGPGDFDLVKTGAQAWEYRYYENQLGTDKSTTVQFSLGNGNMTNARYIKNRLQERTVAIVGGAGDEADRTYHVRTPSYSNYDASNNSIEYYVDASGAESATEEQSIGDASIWEVRADSQLLFDVIQTDAWVYGRDYVLGDIVGSYYYGINNDQKIWGVTVGMDGTGEEKIQLDIRDE